MKRSPAVLAVFAAALSLAVLPGSTAEGFTQSSPVTPPGHEVITVRGAQATALAQLNPEGSEIGSANGCLESDCDTYDTNSVRVWSAVLGQRWTDLMGFFKIQQSKCFDAVAQNNEDVQYDHFLRRLSDASSTGATTAYNGAIQRFVQLFKEAAVADDGLMAMTDGGTMQRDFTVMRAYFLFGRAVHLVEDSFSTEHVTRNMNAPPSSDPTLQPGHRIKDVLSYTSTPDSRYHVHAIPYWGNTSDGDVVFNGGFHGSLRPHAAAATSAMADLWRAFEHAHQARNLATAEADAMAFVAMWMQLDSGFGAAVPSTDGQIRVKMPSGSDILPQPTLLSWRAQCLGRTGSVNDSVPQRTTSFPRPPFQWSTLFQDRELSDPPGTPSDMMRTALDWVTALQALADMAWVEMVRDFEAMKLVLGDGANDLVHQAHITNAGECLAQHTASYGTDRANEAVVKAQAKVDDFWTNKAMPVLNGITDPTTKWTAANGAFSAFRAHLFTDQDSGLNAYRDDRAGHVREWFDTEAHKNTGEANAKTAFQNVLNRFNAALDASLTAHVPKPPAPPPPFFVSAPSYTVDLQETETLSIVLSAPGTPPPMDPADGSLTGSGTSFRYVAPASIPRRRVIVLPFSASAKQITSVTVALRPKLHMQYRVEQGALVDGCPVSIADGQHMTFSVKEAAPVTWTPGPAGEFAPSGNQLTVTGAARTSVLFYPINGTKPPTPPPSDFVQAMAADGRAGRCIVRVPGTTVAVTDQNTANVRVNAGTKVTFSVMGYKNEVTDPLPDWALPTDGIIGGTAQEKAAAEASLSPLRQLAAASTKNAELTAGLQQQLMNRGALTTTTAKGVQGSAKNAGSATAQKASLDVQTQGPRLAGALSFASALNNTYRAPAKLAADKNVTVAGHAKDGSNRSFAAHLTIVK